MNILFDLRATQPNKSGKRHGGGRYGEVVFFRMVEMGIRFSCFYDSRKWFNPEVMTVIENSNIPLYDTAERSLQDIVHDEKIDRVYSCQPILEIMSLKDCDIYGTIHGLRVLETPWDNCFWNYKNSFGEKTRFVVKKLVPKIWRAWEKWKFRKKYVYKSAKLVVVSEHTKYAIKAFFPELSNTKLEVFYSPNTSSGESKRVKSEEKYFLAVSGNRWAKNNVRAIKAFDELISRGLIKGVRMKVAGASNNDIKYKVKNRDAFDFLGYVEDKELEDLYAGAYLFVYPSLNEGFGYPPLEAMRYGVPVIASPFSSMAEVCDQGALYFNPLLVEEIMGRMMMMMNEETYKEYSQRGLKQYQKIYERQKRDLDGLINYITNPIS